jgi:hypothetical protein
MAEMTIKVTGMGLPQLFTSQYQLPAAASTGKHRHGANTGTAHQRWAIPLTIYLLTQKIIFSLV